MGLIVDPGQARKPYVMPSPKQLAAHAFQVGNPGGPGRPRGARSRLQEFTLQLIDEDFREHGKQVLERVRQKWPQVYLTAVIGLLPKQQQKIESPLADFTDAEIEMLERMLTSSRAKLVPELEQNGAAIEPEKHCIRHFRSQMCPCFLHSCSPIS